MTYGFNQLLDVNFTDARFVGGNAETLVGNYQDEATLDTYLAGAPYSMSAATLALMTVNDKVYAARMGQDLLSFGNPGTTSGMS